MAYPVAMASACMGKIGNNRTYGMMGAMGAAMDIATVGGEYYYECDLTTNGNDGHGRVSPFDGAVLTIGGEGSVIRQWAYGRCIVEGPLIGSDAVIAYFPRSNSDDTTSCYILKYNTDGNLELWYDSTTLWGTGSTTISFDEAFDWKILFDHDGLNFWVKVYINGSSTPEIDTSGDTKTPGAYVYRFYIGEDLAAGVNRGVTLYQKHLSFFEQDDDPGWPLIATLTVDGQGTYTDWTGDNTDVDEIPPDDATTAISTDTTSKKESFTLISCSDAGISADAEILGTRVYGWQNDVTGSKYAAYPIMKQGATEIDCNSCAPTATWTNLECDEHAGESLRRLAPDGSALTQTIVNALEIGMRTAASDHADTIAVSSMVLDVLYNVPSAAVPRSWATII